MTSAVLRLIGAIRDGLPGGSIPARPDHGTRQGVTSAFRLVAIQPRLVHQELSMQRPGGIDTFKDVDHVMGSHAQRVQPSHDFG